MFIVQSRHRRIVDTWYAPRKFMPELQKLLEQQKVNTTRNTKAASDFNIIRLSAASEQNRTDLPPPPSPLIALCNALKLKLSIVRMDSISNLCLFHILWCLKGRQNWISPFPSLSTSTTTSFILNSFVDVDIVIVVVVVITWISQV